MKAAEIMTPEVITVKKYYTIRKMINILQEHKITGAPVVDDEENLIGMVSLKDVINAVSDLIKVHVSIEEIERKRGKFNWVEGIMTDEVVTVEEDTDVLAVFNLMVENHIHRVPVMKNGKMTGLISISDSHRAILKYFKKDKE